MLALVAFGAGGFVGLVAAAADETSSVGQLRRSATQADVVPAPHLNVLPLLPAPTERSEDAGLEPREQINSAVAADVVSAARALDATGPIREARPSAPARKSIQHTKKSATWARRSDIIDPWSNRR